MLRYTFTRKLVVGSNVSELPFHTVVVDGGDKGADAAIGRAQPWPVARSIR